VQLYNSLTRKVENFIPNDRQVTLYVCGITPYDTTHLGHAFTYTSVDILIRFLESLGIEVRYVQNVTDIDDDILRKARELGEDWVELGNRWTAHFIQDMKTLNVRPPEFYPRATDVITDIITIVEKLIETGVAYEVSGNVYFDVNCWDQFGKLSGLAKDQMLPIANERGNRPDDPNKHHPLDFVLWQAHTSGEPGWNSPWGPGRPGWHIECSTMSTKFLGLPIDIHAGGADLCFPHHECEIAQLEPFTAGELFVRVWMHVAMVFYEGAKMSKSLGNLVMVRDLLKEYSPDAIRLYLGSHHYRESWSHVDEELSSAQERIGLINSAINITGGSRGAVESESNKLTFYQAMGDDLFTPIAVDAMLDLAKKILVGARSNQSVKEAQIELGKMIRIFGLQVASGLELRVLDGWNVHLQRFPVKAAELD
jgi:L-cysteine:1D-myo-inositol 2-amino-2-deoxy-alpha-D-glucopyranoside ligase